MHRENGHSWQKLIAPAFAVAAIVAATAAAPIGAAGAWTVDTTIDSVDVAPGDGACADAGGACSLRAAVMEANALEGADTITLPAGTYTLTQPGPDPGGPSALVGDLDVGDDLTITGAGSSTTTIAGGPGWSDRLIEVFFDEFSTSAQRDLSLTVSGMRLTGGRSSSVGGAIYFSAVDAQLTLQDMLVSGNATGPAISQSGGGAYVRARAFTLEDVELSDNTATGTGGGLHIHAPDDASVTVASNLELTRNTSVQGGGGLRTTGLGAKLDVTGLVVEDNTTGTASTNGSGGGLFLSADAILRDIRIDRNVANAGGGAIDVQAEITIDGGAIEDNSAVASGTGFPSQGGGIKFHGAPGKKIELTDLVIDGNSAADGGGAWISSSQQSSILPGSRIVLERVAVTDNFVIAPGVNNNSTGGMSVLLVTNSPAATLVNVTLAGNRGGEYGIGSISPSGLRFFGAPTEKPLLRNVTIAHNGPGIALSNNSFGSSVRVENTLVGANQGGTCPAGSTWVASLGGNLEQGSGSGACNFGAGSVVAAAGLGQPVTDAGTTVVPLLDGSPAIDHGIDASCPDVDQRGVGYDRPEDGDLDGIARCDIGAYEFVPVPPSADLSVTKSDSPDPVLVDQDLTYTVVVSNSGPDPAQSVTLTDALPGNVSLDSAVPSQGSCSVTATVSCALGSIAPGASATVTIKVRPTTDADLSNTATVSSSTADPSPGNNSATAETVVNVPPPPSADLSVTKSGSPDPVRVGQELTYAITVSNSGPNPAVGAALTDVLPGNVTFGSAVTSQGSCSGTTTVSCALGTIASGGSATVTIKVTPTSDADLSNTATVASSIDDPNPANNSAMEETVVDPPSTDLALTKSGPASVAVGGAVGYTLTVRNNGPQAASSFTVTDTLPAGVSNARSLSAGCTAAAGTITCSGGTLAVGQSVSFGFTVTAPGSAGSITNTAAISASVPANDVPTNNAASTTTQVLAQGVDLSLTHSTTTTFVELGGTYVLRVTVRNAGPATATNVRVVEQLRGGGSLDGLRYVSGPTACTSSLGPSTVVCTAASIAPGGSVTFNLTLKPWLKCTNIGTTGNETINGTDDPDVLCGGGGNDSINGLGGNDEIYGYGPTGTVVTASGSVSAAEREDGPGNETASTTTDIAGPGFPPKDADTVNGGGGHDVIHGQNGKDNLSGEDGNDTIGGGPGDDSLHGGAGGDLMEGHGGVDKLLGDAGNDRLHGGGDIPATDQQDNGGNLLNGGPGNRLLLARLGQRRQADQLRAQRPTRRDDCGEATGGRCRAVPRNDQLTGSRDRLPRVAVGHPGLRRRPARLRAHGAVHRHRSARRRSGDRGRLSAPQGVRLQELALRRPSRGLAGLRRVRARLVHGHHSRRSLPGLEARSDLRALHDDGALPDPIPESGSQELHPLSVHAMTRVRLAVSALVLVVPLAALTSLGRGSDRI